jgi:hypothetical protein
VKKIEKEWSEMRTVMFTKKFIKGVLKGLNHDSTIDFVDEWHAEDWLRGVSMNTLNGRLDYIIVEYHIVVT